VKLLNINFDNKLKDTGTQGTDRAGQVQEWTSMMDPQAFLAIVGYVFSGREQQHSCLSEFCEMLFTMRNI
jgi:hypothetical protein